jgi:hypothetical protein
MHMMVNKPGLASHQGDKAQIQLSHRRVSNNNKRISIVIARKEVHYVSPIDLHVSTLAITWLEVEQRRVWIQ